MDIITLALAKSYTKNTVIGMGAIKGSPCMISSIVDNLDGTHDITFSWKDASDVTHTSVLTVEDGETPTFSSVAITGGHRITFLTSDPSQSVSFDVMDGQKGDTGVSVISSNVDENNNLTLTLSNGNVINAGKIKAVTTVDNALSTTSSNPVENKVITTALNNKVDKEMGKGLFSDEEKTKLANIEDGAQVNVLEKLIVNGQEATITDKSIALTLITSAVSNLQNYYLKTETYTKQEVEDLIGQTVGVTIEIVEQLPTEGQSNVIYFLPTETEGVYSQYIYTTDGWILIGSTTVDLSNYYTKAQVDTLLNGKQNVLTIDSFPTALSNNPVASGGVYTAIAQMQPQFQFANMPTASASNVGFVYQYTGVTGTYTQNMFYRCIYDDVLGEYKWEEVIFHATVTVDSAISGTSVNPVQNKVIKEALDEKQDIVQYSTMPSAQDNLGRIVQYIGTNTANYTNGYFYKAIYNSESDVYLWTVIKFSADMLVDSALSTTSENPVQNKVITNTINDIQDVIPSEASSTNQLVDRDSLGTASQKNFTPYVSPNNADVPISSSVYSAITNAVYGAYHPSGSKTIAELTSDLLVLANIGNVYKITEDGVTTDLFIGGAGQTIHTGDNAVVVYGGSPNTYLFDLQSGSIDLTPYQTKALESAVEGETTVEGALGALSDNKADKVTNATNGDIATLDANGNLVDSGKTISDVVPLIRIDTTSDSATHGYYKIFEGSTVTASTREVYITGTLHNDSSTPIESSHTQVDLSVRMNKDGASFNGFVSNIPNGFDIIAVGNGTDSYGIYIKAQGAWLKARLKLTANIIGSSSDIIINPTCVASISESVQTNYSDSWHKVVTNEIVPSDASSSNKLVATNRLNNRVREVYRIPYNMTIANFLARFTNIGIHVGEVFIDGNIGDTAVNSWCSYEANIISVTDSYVGNIKITNLNDGTEFLYKSYNTESFNWVLVAESNISVIGQIYSTTTLRATSIPATTDTVVLQVSNLPLGTYIATGSLFGSTTLNNTGGIIQLKVTGNSTSANTVQNSGFLLSGSVNSIFQVTNTSNAVDVTLYCTNAQTVSSGRLMIVRIA